MAVALLKRVGRLLLLCGFFCGPGALADEPWTQAPFSADPRLLVDAAATVSPPPGAHVVVLYRDAAYRFDDEGRIDYRQHLVYRLLTRKGVEGWSRIEVDYAPWHQERPEIRARIISPDGRERRLDESAQTERPAPSEGPDVVADRRVVEMPLPAVTIGAVVEEEIVVRDTEPFFTGGTAGAHLLRMFAPIHQGRLRIEAPVTLPLRYGVRLFPGLKPRQEIAGGQVRLTFEYGETPALAPAPPGLPSHQPRFPQVAFSTGESWQAVAASYSRLVDERIESSGLEAIVGRLASAGGPEEPPVGPEEPPADRSASERIAEILAEVHREIRYTGLELGASSLIPASPDVTLERRFGDCKDQATLLVALLRHEGIPAHVALLSTGFGEDIDPRLPGIGRFNHAIVHVPSTPPVWIDPTDPSARAGELPAADQNRWALITSPETRKLRRTPSANSVDNITVERREVHLADHGPGRVVERSVYRGEQERQQRRIARASSDENRRQGYWEYVESTYLAEELGEFEETDPDDLSQPFTLVLEALGSSRALTDLSEAVVAILQEGLVAGLPMTIRKDNGKRGAPFVLDRPFVTEWHYRVLPPMGFVPRGLPGDEERRFGSARYTRTVSVEGDAVVVDLRFDSGQRYIAPADFEEMRRGVQAFLAEEPILLWFDHRGALELARGRTVEAVEHFRDLAELEPDKAIHRIRLAQALLRVGVGREAERQARLAVELEPASALAHWSLGFALEHDEVGRRFSRGFDRPGALAALERAVELDPEDALPRTELAILLEYDGEGQRYSPGADLDRAIAQYRILRDELGAQNLEVNLISALYWARRWRELYTTTLELGQTPVSRYLHLVALAVLQGPEAAIRESANLSSTPEEQLNLLNSATQHLVIARRYSQAETMLRRVARDAANPDGMLSRAEILGRTQRHEELAVTTETPALLARGLIVALSQRARDRDRLAEIFHPQYLIDRGDEEIALEATIGRMRQEQFQSSGDLPVEAVLDLALAILEPAADGGPRVGYRVRMLNEMDAKKVAFRIYVTGHEGRLVIAAVEDEYGQIGKEVWRRLEAGDLRGAHRWLDWARDALTRVDTDDPYGFQPFARYWTRGTGAFRDKMRLGAALLMCDQPEAAEAVPVLEEAAKEQDDEATRQLVEVALFQAYSRLGAGAELGELSARLLEREPASTLAFLVRAQYLLEIGRLEEVRQLAEARLRLLPRDPEALRLLVKVALRRSDAERAVGYLEEIRDAGHGRTRDDNLWSWLLLFRDPIPGTALELAQRGAAAAQFRDPAMVHTLAAVYAELGRPAEAYQTLVQSLDLKDDPRPESGDWYVFGRIVEEYGFVDLALEYYGRVEGGEDGEAYSVSELAARRLKVLSREGRTNRD